ncbi:hypothetical protein BKA62DRAFT_705503, partial [Auriculariales sp. MPI-PUGE-AT-0066]
MNLNLLRVLHSTHSRTHPILNASLRVPVYAAVTRSSAVAANPMICSTRFFSDFTPAPSPTTNIKPTTEVDTVHTQSINEIQGAIKKTKEPTKHSATSSKRMSASPARKRGQKQKPMSPEQLHKVNLWAELLALPESPNGATSAYGCFVRRCYRISTIIGEFESKKAMDMWRALSNTERQRYTKEAQDNQLRVAEYEEWAQAVGYTSLREINIDRVRFGKKRLRMPASLRPVRKSIKFRAFFEAKVASGEVSISDGFASAKRRARELWHELSPFQKA